MVQLECMDARLNTLTTELYQVNTCVSRIALRQAHMGGFTMSPSPQASEDEDDDDGFSDDNDDDEDEDEDVSSSNVEEMTASQ